MVLFGYVAGSSRAGDNRNIVTFALGGEVDPPASWNERAVSSRQPGRTPTWFRQIQTACEAERLLSLVKAR
ncbi:hypothetical protein [Amycolatopsis thailandensis]|nr:hypothetical protein [Amycolatopsis thailandensis]